MAHLTIYLSDDVERRVRKAAKSAGISVSKWVAERVARSVETSWPPEFLALAGAFPDFPDADELRKGYGEDVPRESLD
ncbi:MAG: CopG family transcriptional regulator [Acidobacteriia bacterium]|nr:CopG family transcriptional regulator [Terriglobia bacterium]